MSFLFVMSISWSESASAPRQRHTYYKGNPCSNWFLGGMVFFPRALAFDFCYGLELFSQGQAVRAFFIRMGFP